MLRYALQGVYAVPLHSPLSILDVACGAGRWAIDMATLFPQANVVTWTSPHLPSRPHKPNAGLTTSQSRSGGSPKAPRETLRGGVMDHIIPQGFASARMLAPLTDCEDATTANFTLLDNPITNINWRRHRRGCPHYRERWFMDSDLQAGEPMYQVFCGLNTPPESVSEQERCLTSKTRCWRLTAAQQSRGATATATAPDIPLSSVKRRRPA